MPKGEIVGMFTGRVCLSLMERSECAAMAKQEQRKLRRISVESHVVRRCAPGTRLTHCQSSREIAYSGLLRRIKGRGL
jgi:hypothetical protein